MPLQRFAVLMIALLACFKMASAAADDAAVAPRVARLIADQNNSNDHAANVAGALYVLGYENTADSYGLAAKAAAIHAKDAPVRRAVKVAA